MKLASDIGPTSVRPRLLWSVQYLRAFAAISVVIFHQIPAHSAFRLGQYGVDLFFIISGFIIFALTDGRGITPTQFIIDRLTRIAPPYWIATLLAFGLATFHFQFYGASNSLPLLIKSLFFVPSDDGHGHIWPTLFLGWTLNYEMFFYIVFAAVLFIPQSMRLACLTGIFALAIIFGALLSPTVAIYSTYTNPRLAEFLAGAWIGSIYGANPSRSSLICSAFRYFIIIFILAVAAVVFRQLIFGTISAIILSSCLMLEKFNRMPKIAFLKLLGDASYAVYLFQQFAFEGVREACRHVDALTGLHFQDHAAAHLLSVAAALGLGLTVFLTVERPLTRSVRRLLSYSFKQSASVAG